MRVAMLVPRFPKLSETFILNQITGLLDLGHEVDIYAAAPGRDERNHPEVETYRLRERTVYLNIPGPVRKRLGVAVVDRAPILLAHAPGSLLGALNFARHGRKALSLSLLFSAAAFAQHDPYDILHAQFGNLGPGAAALLAIGATDGALVMSFRGSDLTPLERTHAYHEVFRRARFVMPVCEAFGRELVGRGCEPDKIRVVHSGIQTGKFPYEPRARAPGEATRIISVGRLKEKKGITFGLQAVAEARRSGRPVHYTVVGDGELRDELEDQARRLGIEGIVEFLGSKTHEELPGLLSKAHLCLAPSVLASDGDKEGIPNVLKEAMASGMPVVSTHHSGIPELVQDGVTGVLVAERDVAALSQALVDLIDRPESWSAMGRAGRGKVEREFDSVVVNRRLIEVYEDAANLRQ